MHYAAVATGGIGLAGTAKVSFKRSRTAPLEQRVAALQEDVARVDDALGELRFEFDALHENQERLIRTIAGEVASAAHFEKRLLELPFKRKSFVWVALGLAGQFIAAILSPFAQ